MVSKIVAHVKQKEDGGWEDAHLLDDHLRSVEKIAEEFAQNIGGHFCR